MINVNIGRKKYIAFRAFLREERNGAWGQWIGFRGDGRETDPLANRAEFARKVREFGAETGYVRVNSSGRDCDGYDYNHSFKVIAIPVVVEHWVKMTYESADGICSVGISRV